MEGIPTELITPDPWLQYGSLGVLALYIVLHWFERRDIRRRTDKVLRGLSTLLAELKVMLDERLPHN
ncbi:MAG: hypothetical protein ACXABY_03785 [Candidatus Thorarchaeota archaeon]|jgi:hypothetical protein